MICGHYTWRIWIILNHTKKYLKRSRQMGFVTPLSRMLMQFNNQGRQVRNVRLDQSKNKNREGVRLSVNSTETRTQKQKSKNSKSLGKACYLTLITSNWEVWGRDWLCRFKLQEYVVSILSPVVLSAFN